MERRLLLVFALTFLVIVLFQPLLKKYLPQPSTPPGQTQNQVPAQPLPAGNLGEVTRAKTAATATGATKQAASESDIVVENGLYRITFTNRGAQVKSWVLKKFQDDQGAPLDLVNNAAAQRYGYPLSLWTYDEDLRDKLNSGLYVSSRSGALNAPGEITFEWADQDLVVRKSFRFDDTYVVQVESSVSSKGSTVSAFPAWPAGFGDQTTAAGYHASQIEYQHDSSTQRLEIKKVSSGNTVPGPFNWAALTDAYFAAVFIPDNPQDVSLVTLHNSIAIPKDPQKPNTNETTPADVLGVAVGSSRGETSTRLFVGPKALQLLESVAVPTIQNDHQDLRGLVNFGTFGIIARPLFVWLRWTYNLPFVHNWGWAIVLQTLIITVALLPLRISSMKSALKMQKIQPQMTSIKEKYKKYGMRDPRRQEMNTEIGALMKSEGVNPVGGCLPLIIQLPFIWAYYRMLGSAIELRQAHWLWIHDLSSRDPLFLLPILLVISMVATQRMTPQAGMDPAQQKMLNWMMPLMMGFIFFNLAAGLNLYYAESNLIAIAQQAVMNRTSMGREMREIALKRARKKEKK